MRNRTNKDVKNEIIVCSPANFKRSLQRISFAFSHLRFRWFFCFGTLLGIIRDNGPVKNDSDIDIGVFFDDLVQGDNEHRMKTVLKGVGYKEKSVIYPKGIIPPTPLNISFSHPELPTIDIFAWYKIGKKLYHTYDIKQERKKYLSKYIMKGVRKEWLEETIRIRIMEQWIYIPLKYGTLLDEWYPNWILKQKGVSKTSWTKEIKKF